MTYAKATNVAVPKSKGEIERMIKEAGGSRFGTMDDVGKTFIFFELHDRRIMFELPLPKLSDFGRDSRGYTRATAAQERLHDQALRARWRALVLALKAKLVSVESGVEQFEEAFLGQIVVPGVNGVGADRFVNVGVRAIKQAYEGFGMPPLLGSGK